MYKKAQQHFKKVDQKLHAASLEFAIPDLKIPDASDAGALALYRDICWTIIGQQLSGKAADTIFGRFEALFKGAQITPDRTLSLDETALRGCGLSGAKMRAIRDLSTKVRDGDVDLARLPLLPDTEVLAELTKVKGIGPWTAEMLLMFSLGRADVFSAGDLGLQKGVMHLYNLRKMPSEKRLAQITGAWAPYRTYAARILWRIADQKKMRIARKRSK